MAAGSGNKMRLYYFVLMPFGGKIDESSKIVELILGKSGAPYSPGRFPGWGGIKAYKRINMSFNIL